MVAVVHLVWMIIILSHFCLFNFCYYAMWMFFVMIYFKSNVQTSVQQRALTYFTCYILLHLVTCFGCCQVVIWRDVHWLNIKPLAVRVRLHQTKYQMIYYMFKWLSTPANYVWIFLEDITIRLQLKLYSLICFKRNNNGTKICLFIIYFSNWKSHILYAHVSWQADTPIQPNPPSILCLISPHSQWHLATCHHSPHHHYCHPLFPPACKRSLFMLLVCLYPSPSPGLEFPPALT